MDVHIGDVNELDWFEMKQRDHFFWTVSKKDYRSIIWVLRSGKPAIKTATESWGLESSPSPLRQRFHPSDFGEKTSSSLELKSDDPFISLYISAQTHLVQRRNQLNHDNLDLPLQRTLVTIGP